jgi:hypothetical protein
MLLLLLLLLRMVRHWLGLTEEVRLVLRVLKGFRLLQLSCRSSTTRLCC